MRVIALFITVLLVTNTLFAQTGNFSDYFNDTTMRVDYFHHGKSDYENFSIDRVVNDGPWAGSKTQLLDEIAYGLYFYEVEDAETGMPLYSRGFASIFGEWQTIPEAEERIGTFHESIRFPWPLKPVKVIMKKRNPGNNEFEEIWQTTIDPEARAVNKARKPAEYKTWDLMVNGPAETKVDIVILGDGYAHDEMEKFHNDIERLTLELLAVEPFKSRKGDFNIRAVETPANESGVNKPHPGIFKRTPLSVSYSSFDSERYALTYDNKKVRDVASEVPYDDFMFILINERTYGGGGIYRLYATVAADNAFSDYIFVHEFGHHFAALADEYYSSSVSYKPQPITVEPWEANVTALLDGDNFKWNDMVDDNTPIPTPWEKESFDKFSLEIQKERSELRAAKAPEEELEALFLRQREHETQQLYNMEYSGKVGAFEGCSYHQYGLYRPYCDCIMFTRNNNDFCPVCQRAIETVMEQYVK